MSGEIVLTPAMGLGTAIGSLAVVGAAVVIGGPAAALVGVGKIVQKIVDNRVEAAKKKIEAEKSRLHEWHAYQEQQKLQMDKLKKIQQSIETSENRLKDISLTAGSSRHSGTGPTAQGYSSLNRPNETLRQVRSQLEVISKILMDLPDCFTEAASSPYKRLLKQRDILKKKSGSDIPPTIEEIDAFRETVLGTLKTYMKELEMKRQTGIRLKQKAETLFDEIMVYLELAVEEKHINDLNKIKTWLLEMVDADQLRWGQVELVEKKFAVVKGEVDLQVTRAAITETAADSLNRNLQEMGYKPFEPFAETAQGRMRTGTMRIPGGEFLRIAIHHDNKLSFQVTHAASTNDTPISELELQFFREQEKKWCRDFQELIRCLTAEGFSYTIGLERLIPDNSIPLVVFESARDIDPEEEEDMDRFNYEPKRRTLL